MRIKQNKLITILTIALATLALFAPFAQANYVETQNFFEDTTGDEVDNVKMLTYECKNSDCTTVNQPPVHNVTSGSDNSVTVTYPDKEAEYLQLFFADGYMVKTAQFELPADFDTEASIDYFFRKVDSCKSPIDSFSMTQETYPGEPISINVTSDLQASATSAFKDMVDVYEVPGKEDYYSAETEVTLQIENSLGQTVDTKKKTLNLYQDTTEDLSFSWVPQNAGDYTVSLTTDVTDNQCSSSSTQSTSKELNVLEEPVSDACYTLINDLTASDKTPETGEEFTLSYNRLSNYEDENDVKTSTPTKIDYTVREGKIGSTGSVVESGTTYLSATDTLDPSEEELSLSIDNSGWYTVSVNGKAESDLCSDVPNHEETAKVELNVEDNLADITFTTFDNNGLVGNATINLDGKTSVTNSAGGATIEGVDSGTYTYEISHPDYKTISDTVEVGEEDMFLQVELSNTADSTPNMNLDSIDPLKLQADSSRTIDFKKFISDAEEASSELDLTVSKQGSEVTANVMSDNKVMFESTSSFDENENIEFTVEDSNGNKDSYSLTIKVNEKLSNPELTGLPDVSVNENDKVMNAFNLENFASDSETQTSELSFDLSNNNCGTSIDSSNNVDVQPPLSFTGSCTITATVTDEDGMTDSDSFTVEVSDVNQHPEITTAPVKKASVGSEYTYNVRAVDDDGDTLSFSLVESPSGMTISSDGKITWTPSSTGTYDVSVRVEDGNGGFATQEYTLEVPTENNAPVITSAPFTEASKGVTYKYDVEAVDEDTGDVITYSLVESPTGMTIDSSNGFITWTPSELGDNNVTIKVEDNEGASSMQSYTLSVVDKNRAPTITSEPVTVGTANVSYSYDVEASDPDGDMLVYSLVQSPSGMSIDSNSGVVSWTPTETGNHTVTVRASDNKGGTDTQVYNLEVTADNLQPKITSEAKTEATTTSTYKYKVKATDPEGGKLMFSLVKSPSGMSISSEGEITWNPTVEMTEEVIVRVEDSGGDFTLQSFNITVTEDGVGVAGTDLNEGSRITSVGTPAGETVSAGRSARFSISFENENSEDIEDVRYSASSTRWGVSRTTGPFDVDSGDELTREVSIEVPEDAESGYHFVRLGVSSNNVRKVMYRPIIVR